MLLSPDERLLAISEWGHISFFDTNTNQFVGEIPVGKYEGIPVGLNTFPLVADIAFSPDNKILAAITSVNTITFFDVATFQAIGEPLKVGELYVKNGVTKIAYAKNGNNLLTAYPDGTLSSWNLESQQPTQLWHPFQTKDSWVLFGYGASFSSDGSIAVVRDGNVIRLLETQNGREISEHLKGIVKKIESMSFSPDGKVLAVANGENVILWSLIDTQSLGQVIADHGEVVGFAPDGSLLMAGLNFDEGFPRLALWDFHHTSIQ